MLLGASRGEGPQHGEEDGLMGEMEHLGLLEGCGNAVLSATEDVVEVVDGGDAEALAEGLQYGHIIKIVREENCLLGSSYIGNRLFPKESNQVKLNSLTMIIREGLIYMI